MSRTNYIRKTEMDRLCPCASCIAGRPERAVLKAKKGRGRYARRDVDPATGKILP